MLITGEVKHTMTTDKDRITDSQGNETLSKKDKSDGLSDRDRIINLYNTDIFTFYDKLKKGEITDPEIDGFLKALAADARTLDLGEDEELDTIVFDNIQKAALIFDSRPEILLDIDNEIDYSSPVSLYRLYFSILAEYANITYRTDSKGENTFSIQNILGEIDFSLTLSTAMPAARPEKIDPAEVKKLTRKGITSAVLALICLLPHTRAFFATELGIGLGEPIMFAALAESVLRGKKKGFLLYVAYIIGMLIIAGKWPISKATTLSLAFFYALRAVITLPKAIKLKKKFKKNNYHEYITSTRPYFYEELDSMIEVLNILKREISPKLKDSLHSEAVRAYFDHCISEFRDIRNRL